MAVASDPQLFVGAPWHIRAGVDAGRWSAVLFIDYVADKRALLNNVTQDATNVADWNRIAVSQPRTPGNYGLSTQSAFPSQRSNRTTGSMMPGGRLHSIASKATPTAKPAEQNATQHQ